MKRLVKILIIVMTFFITKNVYAANYEIRELIPVDTKTTIVTKNFSYRDFSYSNGSINFTSIKNLTDEKKKISISIGLFNENKKNIGTINYCDSTLDSKQEKSHKIEVTNKYLGKDYEIKDIKYISVLGDNIKCRTTGYDEFIGQTVQEIGMAKNKTLDSKTELLIKILSIVFGVLFILFIYKLLFTKSYQNFDGSDIRQGYKKYNKELKEQREYEARVNPPAPKEVKKIKTDEVLMQEEKAKNEDKSGTDLHNLYK